MHANCPECGTVVTRSLEGDRLAGAELAWLRKIARGAGLLAWGWTALLAVPATVVFFTMTIIAFLAGWGAREVFFLLFFIVIAVCGLGGLLLTTAGTFFITIQDPRDTLREKTYSSRRLARIGMVGAVAGYVAALLLAGLMPITMAKEILLTLLGGVVLLFATVGIVSLLKLLATLLVRVPDTKRATHANSIAKFMAWALPAAILIQAGATFLESGPRSNGVAWTEVLSVVGGCSVLILWLVIYIVGIVLAVLLFRSRRMVKKCLAEAKQREGPD